MQYRLLASMVCLAALTGCASLGTTMKSNAFIGASLGAAAGATTGTFVGSPDHAVRGALIGTAVGAAVGGLIGYLTEPKSTMTVDVKPIGAVQGDSDAPKLTPPVIRKVWQADKIEDGKYVQGHYIWVLERGSVWSMP